MASLIGQVQDPPLRKLGGELYADPILHETWVDGEALEQVGLRAEHSLALAIDMAKLERSNEFGVPGYSYMARDPKGSKDFPRHNWGVMRFHPEPIEALSNPGI